MKIQVIRESFQAVLDQFSPEVLINKMEQVSDRVFFSLKNLNRDSPKELLARRVTDKLYENGLKELYVEVDENGQYHVIDLVNQLQKWVDNPSIQGDKLTAAEEILDCYSKRLTKLYLEEFELEELPQEIGQLRELEVLDLDGNHLKKLPQEIGQLRELRVLQLGGNQLEELPQEIGQLTKLQQLDLEENQIKKLPQEIGQLIELQELVLQDNQLKNLPQEMGQLRELQKLYLGNNLILEPLPISLGNIPTLLFIDIDINSETVRQSVNAILASCQRLRGNENSAKLPAILNLWKTFADTTKDLSFILALEKEVQITITEWLLRLSYTREFAKNQTQLATIVCDKLALLQTNDGFKNIFLAIAENNNACCEDRSAMSFNLTYTHFKLCSLSPETPFEEKFKVYMQSIKTWTLRRHIESLINEQEKKTNSKDLESVEVFLYVETALRESLNLLSAIESHRFAGTIGNKSYINLDEIKKYVEEHYLNELTQFPGIEEIAKQDLDFAKEWKAIEDAYSRKSKGKEELIQQTFTADMNSDKNRLLKEWAEKLISKTSRKRKIDSI